MARLRPVDAVGQAADILIDQFSLFSAMGRPELPQIERSIASHPSLPIGADRYNTPIEDLNLSVRAYNCLKRSGLMTVGQVLERSEDELLNLRNFGRKSYDELRDKLVEMGYVDGDAPGLQAIPEPRGAEAARPGAAVRPSAVIVDEEEEESLGALGKALKEALRDVGDDDLFAADDED